MFKILNLRNLRNLSQSMSIFYLEAIYNRHGDFEDKACSAACITMLC